MAMCYKKLWKLLIDRDMTRADLRKETGISPATIAKMSKGEPVGAGIFERICEALHYNIGDIADYVPKPVEQGSGNGMEATKKSLPSTASRQKSARSSRGMEREVLM